MKTPIHDMLKAYSGKKHNIRCHMPGGKGKPYPHDITEIYGADSLYECSSVIEESERITAGLFSAHATLFSAGGTTLAVQTGLSYLKKIGVSRIAAGRYSHKSFISAAVLLGFEVDFIYPKEFLSAELPGAGIDGALKRGAEALFITNIDYYGRSAPLRIAGELARSYNIPLICDNAHGAYKVFTGEHPLKYGALLSMDSAHKTLPAMTGASYLHAGINMPDIKSALKDEMALFGSSSPSYLILESLDLLNAHIEEEKGKAHKAFCAVKELKEKLTAVGYKLIPCDELRVTVRTKKYGYTGYETAGLLRGAKPYSAECELADSEHIVLLFSTITEARETEIIFNILKEIPRKPEIPETHFPVLRTEKAEDIRTAYYGKNKTVPITAAKNEICARITAPCPPGIPLIMPGERYSPDIINLLSMLGVTYVSVLIPGMP